MWNTDMHLLPPTTPTYSAAVGTLTPYAALPCAVLCCDGPAPLLHRQVRQRLNSVARVLRRGPRLQKKLGEVVYKGHFSYSLMLELQLGIRYSVGRGLWPRATHMGGSGSGLLSFAGFGVLAPWASSMSGVLANKNKSKAKEEKRWMQQQEAERRRQRSSSGASGGGSSGGGGREDGQQQQQSQQREFGHVLAGVSDVLSEQLERGDFKEERTVYFPSCGRCVAPEGGGQACVWTRRACG